MDLDRAGLRMRLFRVEIRRAVTNVSVSLATNTPLTKSVKVTTDLLAARVAVTCVQFTLCTTSISTTFQ